MTDQVVAPPSDVPAAPAAPAAPAVQPPADPAVQQVQQSGQAPADAPKGDEKPAEAPGDKPADDAPVEYDLTLPEGFDMPEATGAALKDFLSKHKLPADAAKDLTALGVQMKQAEAEMYQKTRDGWVESVKSDQEIGGDSLDANLGLAKRALDTFGSPELKNLLEGSGFGDHPEIIRAFVRVGKAISDDSLVVQQGGGPAAKEKSRAQQMFPSMANP